MAVLSSKAEATVEPIVYIVDDDDRMKIASRPFYGHSQGGIRVCQWR